MRHDWHPPLRHPRLRATRNQQLKALGNGVVPAQSAAATRAFLEDFAQIKEMSA